MCAYVSVCIPLHPAPIGDLARCHRQSGRFDPVASEMSRPSPLRKYIAVSGSRRDGRRRG